MDLDWIDVGSVMSILAIAALVASFIGMSGNTWLAAPESRSVLRSAAAGWSRRLLKQG